MIEIKDLKKSYDGFTALDGISLIIREGQVFGLIGTNGAGKSTLLRIVTGVMRPDSGDVTVDQQKVYDNAVIKQDMFFIADEPYFFPNSSPKDMKQYYRRVYPKFDAGRFGKLLSDFGLDQGRKIGTFSKGMKKQLAVALGISAGTRYLFCDETFDGLDPVMRQGVKAIFARDIVDRGLTPVIASHNLRELEDICDHVGLLHRGGVLLSRDVDELKLGIQKLQCVFIHEEDMEKALDGLEVLSVRNTGRLHTFTIRGTREELTARFREVPTVFFEILPLTLEEVFISETEVAGYDIKKFLL